MKKRAIPQVPKDKEPRLQFDSAVKENLESIQGLRGGRITPLSSTATNAEIVAAFNALLEVLQ